ncbi:hypothetical protein [Crenobacter cavernae]|uniref:Uncharacterized protein n=1 Tax=Crenobacter cavernae TaxID=2290923 RepID=A0A345Y3H1_9NEIS|nr:hypothetical protein [Crenobacter cavernae]AXK38473.1 hypothetical protein DWG20_02985 [Crenobacter cavernae]
MHVFYPLVAEPEPDSHRAKPPARTDSRRHHRLIRAARSLRRHWLRVYYWLARLSRPTGPSLRCCASHRYSELCDCESRKVEQRRPVINP